MKKAYPQDGKFQNRCKIPGKHPQLYSYAHNNKREFEREEKQLRGQIIYLGKGKIHSIGGVKQGGNETLHFWRIKFADDDIRSANAAYRKSRLLL